MTILLKICMENWKRADETLNALLELEPEQLYILRIWVEVTKEILETLKDILTA